MSKESANSDNQIKYIEAQIEALRRQRQRFERLIIMFRDSQQVLDQWTTQYIELLEMKRELGLKLISVPQNERESLKEVLGSKKLEGYDSIIDESIPQLVSEGKILTIAEMETTLVKIDTLIVELIVCVNQIKKGDKEAIGSAKEIILKKVAPIIFGLALIGVDIPSQNWPTVIGGGYIIYTASAA